MIPNHTPDTCWVCGSRGRVCKSVRCDGYIRRRHACDCGKRWTTYQSRMNPRRQIRRVFGAKRSRRTT
jgi:hypothetical protein